jgi:hypothetical protein
MSTNLQEYLDSLTWRCHICGEVRPDAKISVRTKRHKIDGEVVFEENVRYCNDKVACRVGSQSFSFFPSIEPSIEENKSDA